MKKYIYALIIMLFSVSCYAAPFVVSDPVKIDGTEPTSYTAMLNGSLYTVIPYVADATHVCFRMDLAGKWNAGSNTIKVKATNAYGESDYSIPLSFNAGVPAVPSGVKLSQ